MRIDENRFVIEVDEANRMVFVNWSDSMKIGPGARRRVEEAVHKVLPKSKQTFKVYVT